MSATKIALQVAVVLLFDKFLLIYRESSTTTVLIIKLKLVSRRFGILIFFFQMKRDLY